MVKSKLLMICGSGHNGSTILARILLGHPSIAGPLSETFCFCHTLRSHWLALIDEMARGFGYPVWLLEKTPVHVYSASDVLEEIPDSRVVLLIRDGRDVTISLSRSRYSLENAVERWVKSTYKTLEIHSKHPERSIIIRYEDLIMSSKETLSLIADFLSVSKKEILCNAYKPEEVEYLGNRSSALNRIVGGLSHNQRRSVQASQPLWNRLEHPWKDACEAEKNRVIGNSDMEFLLKALGYMCF